MLVPKGPKDHSIFRAHHLQGHHADPAHRNCCIIGGTLSRPRSTTEVRVGVAVCAGDAAVGYRPGPRFRNNAESVCGHGGGVPRALQGRVAGGGRAV